MKSIELKHFLSSNIHIKVLIKFGQEKVKKSDWKFDGLEKNGD